MPTARLIFAAAVAASGLTAAGCSSVGDGLAGGEQSFPPSEVGGRDGNRRAGVEGSVLDLAGVRGEGGVTIGSRRPGDALAGNVNRHLWVASLETLDFLPIASTDPFTGVIATDWGAAPDAPGERFKVNVYVTDVALNPNALRVAVFREVMNAQGAWVPTDVAPETPRQIEDAILVRARQLRIAEAEAAQRG